MLFAQLPPLHVEGAKLVDPKGKAVLLRGCNLGNWFVTENWMWDQNQPDGGPQDQYQIEALLEKRFGVKEKDRLMDLHRASWITDRDLAIIKTFRFNCVRLPLNYRQFEDDERPYRLRKDAFIWVDKAVAMAAKHGLYTILDMHGVQGGQSVYDHTGRSGQNKLWTDPENSKRLAWLWGEIAKRYRTSAAVVAYDVFNEPYGGEHAQIRDVFTLSYHNIRKHDPDKLIWAMGRYDSFDFYGDPKANGWRNVGMQMHYYPGLFGNGAPTLRTNARHLEQVEREVAPKIRALNVPYLIGEMNVVFESAGGAQTMRRTFDVHERLGWCTSMWSYKALSRPGGYDAANWGMVTNRRPFAAIDFSTASKQEIEAWFKSGATMEYAINERLRAMLAPVKSPMGPMPKYTRRLAAPQGQVPGWQMNDVGGPRRGGASAKAGLIKLYGGGSDIWGPRDQFRFVYRPVKGDFTLTCRIQSVEDLGSYCKAGVMIRKALDADAPHVLLSTFPNGEIQLAQRSRQGGDTNGAGPTKVVAIPVSMRMQRRGNIVTLAYRANPAEPWSAFGKLEIDFDEALVGVVALSHDDGELVEVVYRNLELKENQ